MDLTQDDVMAILSLIDASSYTELHLELGDLKLHVIKHGGSGAGGNAVAAPEAPPDAEAVGTSPAPDPPAATAPAAASSGPTAVVAGSTAGARSQAERVGDGVPEGLVAVRAAMLGTFYRAPAPDAPPFAREGDEVTADQTIGLLEVMKLFNAVTAGVRGRVVRFMAENGSMVEYDQVLALIDPGT
jgi:acetyl-CoA carboxylase biotin carboxyl carrier protein